MGLHRFRIESDAPRPAAWSALTDDAGLTRWTGFDRCLGIAGESLLAGSSLRCAVSVGDRRVTARVRVLDVSPRSHVAIQTTTHLAVTSERVHLVGDDDGGTTVEYSLAATSSAHGPAVNVFIARHLEAVQDGLEELLDAEAHYVHPEGRTG